MSFEERLRILRIVDLSLAVTAIELQLPFRIKQSPQLWDVSDNFEVSLYVTRDDAAVLERPRDFAIVRDERLLGLAQEAFQSLAAPHASFGVRIAAPNDPDLDQDLARHGLTGPPMMLKEAGFDREVGVYRRARRLRRTALLRMLKWADVTLGSLALVPMLTAVIDPIKEFKEVTEIFAEHEPAHWRRVRLRKSREAR
jgi:hypothetical protein